MDQINNNWTNELMETEDQLLVEIQEEYRRRAADSVAGKLGQKATGNGGGQ